MKQRSSLLSASLLLFCLLLAVGCSTPVPPAVQSVTGSGSIAAGETGFIRWTFLHTDSVRISSLPGMFKPVDIVYVAPLETTTYTLTGFRNGDSATTRFTIQVIPAEVRQPVTDVETGGEIDHTPIEAPALAESSVPSLYYSGSTAAGDRPEQIKIMRVTPAHGGATPSFHALVLDQYGNFLERRDTLFGVIKSNCVGSFTTLSMTAGAREVTGGGHPVSIALVAEYSQPMADLLPALEDGYRRFFQALAPNDEVSFIRYDHRARPAFQRVSPERALADFVPGTTHRGGLSAVYKAAWAGLKAVKPASGPRALVLLTGGSENSSLLYTAGDIAETARSLGIPIYTIAVGMDAETYSLRYLSEYSGGRFYRIIRPEEAADVLQEIAYSYRRYYDVSYNPRTDGAEELERCPGIVYTTLTLGHGMEGIREMRVWNADRQAYYPYHQVVATFPEHAYEIPSIYDEQIASLSVLLKDNPDKSIELIGHADPGLSDGDAAVSSLRRAQAVREALIARGVQSAQIRTRGAGSAVPMFYFANREWQQDLNRRVELRWLDPALLPFEIVAQTVYTEQEAERLTDLWEQRGQQAYYELIMANKTPAFRIKLWGYETYDSALNAKTVLEKKYRVPLAVQ